MTVAELIERLREMPQDAVVIVPAMLGWIDDYIEREVTAESVKSYLAKEYDSVDGRCWAGQSHHAYNEIAEQARLVVEIR